MGGLAAVQHARNASSPVGGDRWNISITIFSPNPKITIKKKSFDGTYRPSAGVKTLLHILALPPVEQYNK